ncbi:hypothetical protein SOQ14_00980 [Erythrobacter sp. T5W1-R]|uniref:hypothetical protein n=1 Tax=Erythrobacter sp. T5W1-R TaxID=3101752 RepID=UPI002AFFCDBC|nr:hypothetical protein [Erythrobacter sp. T5W1-R]MEA1617486.1 hypothetical protein [Erythrobacter sp. T5W1-R]
MSVGRGQMHSLGWAAVLAMCLGVFAVLSVRVHAVKSEVLLAERKIIALKRESMLLETEFETRASQRQLVEWNAVEFGFVAPRADQFLEGERQLASLGQPLGPGAPAQIRLARATTESDESAASAGRQQTAMVSPLSGEKVTLAAARADADAGAMFADAFGDFLIEASPIRPARAQSAAASVQASVAGTGE